MKKKNKKKFILLGILISLLVSIGVSALYLQGDEKQSFYRNLSESIITKQPNLKLFSSEKENNTDVKQKEEKNDPQKVQEEKTTSNENIKNKSSNQTKNTTNNTNSKKSNITSNITKNKSRNTTNKTNDKKSNITSNKTSNKPTNTNSNTTTTKVTGNFNQAEAKKLLSLVNKVRKENGLKEVSWNNSLESSAQIRAKETYTKFNHTRPNGTKYNTAINTKYKTSGENIAAGQSSATEVFNSWMNSAGHKKNILSPNFTQMGVAVYYDKNSTYQYYWSQLFIG